MSERQTGLDLIRCIAFFFVIVFHSFLYNGYYSIPQTGALMWMAGSLRWLSVCCNGLFLMLTGYLRSDRPGWKECYQSLPTVLIGYFLAAAISIPVRHLLLEDQRTIQNWILSIFSFSAVYYGWYVEMYVGLILLSPFLNQMLNSFPEKRNLMMLLIVLSVLTALPGATPLNIAPDYWKMIYPITYYVFGAAVRRFKPKIPCLICVVSALLVAFVLGGLTVLSTDNTLSEAVTWEFGDIWIVWITVLVFLGLYRVRLNRSMSVLLRCMAGGCYGGCLISHLMDTWCYQMFSDWHVPVNYWKVFICVTLPIYWISLLFGYGLNRFTKYIIGKGKTLCIR